MTPKKVFPKSQSKPSTITSTGQVREGSGAKLPCPKRRPAPLEPSNIGSQAHSLVRLALVATIWLLTALVGLAYLVGLTVPPSDQADIIRALAEFVHALADLGRSLRGGH